MSEEFGSYGKIISGYAFKSTDLHNVDDIPVIKIGNIGNGGNIVFGNETQYVDKEFLDKLDKKFVVNNGDILISLTGSHINQPNSMVGRSCRYLHNAPSLLNQRAGKIFPKENADSMYLYYLIHSNYFIQNIGIRAYGAANQANISPKDIEKIKWNFPDLPTQTRIATILSAYDDAIENNNRRIVLLEKAARELYREWFVRFRFPGYENAKFLNGLPMDWEIRKIGEIVRLQRGHDLPITSVRHGVYPVVGSSGVIAFHDKATTTPPVIVLGRSGSVGNPKYYDCECWVHNTAIYAKEIYAEPLWVFYVLCQMDFSSLVGGSAVPTLNRNHVETQKVLIPDRELQKKFGLYVKNIFLEKSIIQSQCQNLARQRDLLLPRLMSGKLEV